MKLGRKPGDPKRAISILRVSTQDQHLGPKAQMASIETWAARSDVFLAATFLDIGVSGAARISDRRGLVGALAALRELNCGLLVAAKRDRLARDIAIAREIERLAAKEGAVVRTADGIEAKGANGRLHAGLLDLFGEHERLVIGERTCAALAVKKARGERLGCVPYGFKVAADGVHLEPDEDESEMVAHVNRLYRKGVKISDIVAYYRRVGVLSRVGKPFQRTQIVNMIRR